MSLLEKYKSPSRKDNHSYAEPNKAITTHLDLNLRANFESNTLSGHAKFDILHKDSSEIIFDTKHLNITKVCLDDEHETSFELKGDDPIKGSALHVPLRPETNTVTIYYNTNPSAEAVQWLTAEQTADKKHPFLFTQGQAILTRTWIPCQDSPGIRITYEASIEVPSHLMAVMSASNTTNKNEDGIYHFKMNQAIPPYLIALAIGDLVFESIGPRTGVYAEPSMLAKSAFEFSDMEKMLVTAEALYGPYLWERYDVIVLPPSFPFGGMENPRLTFATPTIIAGDKSLTSLIAHELAHSWSGNLVTNATWNDFWLNEGFTVYFERRIMEALYGEDFSKMLSMLGCQDLHHTVDNIGQTHEDTHLKLNLQGRNPDVAMTDIAYEKGAAFLTSIERKIGKPKFDLFITEYFEAHKFQSITTDEFIAYLNEHLIKPENIEINFEEWIFNAGLPENCPVFKSDKFQKIDKAVALIHDEKIPDAQITEKWSTHEWLHYIRSLPVDLALNKMSILEHAYQFSSSGNSEIAAAWYLLSIKNGYYKENLTHIENFLVEVGRRKFLTPIYRALKEANELNEAKRIYAAARSNYHAVSKQTMDELLLIN